MGAGPTCVTLTLVPDKNETWGTLTGLNVTLLQRWYSAWADLQFAGMSLFYLAELESKPANIFRRRALWESAVVSYGRCAVSARKRKIPFVDFVKAVAGDDGHAVHERIMDWRHGHVAHRNSADFESVETILAYAPSGGRLSPTEMKIQLAVGAGPDDDTELVTAFERLVETVRNAMYEQKIRPLAVDIVDDLNARRVPWPSELRPPEDRSLGGRYVYTGSLLTLSAAVTD